VAQGPSVPFRLMGPAPRGSVSFLCRWGLVYSEVTVHPREKGGEATGDQ
jgi:hypothetical protein